MPHWLQFGGSIGRVRFLACLSAVIIAPLVGGLLFNSAAHKDLSAPLFWLLVGTALAFVALLLWVLAAAITQRLRDAGLPVWLLPALIAVGVADGYLAEVTGWRALWPDVRVTPFGSAATVAFWAALLLWPGRRGDDERRMVLRLPQGPILVAGAVVAMLVGTALTVDAYQPAACAAKPRPPHVDCARFGFAGRAYAVMLLVRANEALDENEPAKAVALIDRVLAIRPNQAFALNSRGLAYAALGDHGAAKADYAAALAAAPTYIKAHANRGYSHLVLGEVSAAEADFAVVRAADPRTRGRGTGALHRPGPGRRPAPLGSGSLLRLP